MHRKGLLDAYMQCFSSSLKFFNLLQCTFSGLVYSSFKDGLLLYLLFMLGLIGIANSKAYPIVNMLCIGLQGFFFYIIDILFIIWYINAGVFYCLFPVSCLTALQFSFFTLEWEVIFPTWIFWGVLIWYRTGPMISVPYL